MNPAVTSEACAQDAGAISALVVAEAADVLCLQETKLQDQHCEGVEASLGLGPGWHCTWNCSQAAKGYSGTAILSRRADADTLKSKAGELDWMRMLLVA